MAIGPRLDLRQSQQLVMTPQLQQAIKLLALSNLELEGFVIAELEKNPLLEVGEDQGEREAVETDSDGGDGDGFDDGDTLTASDTALMRDDIAQGTTPEAALDIAVEDNIYQNDSPSDRSGEPDGAMSGMEGLSLTGTGSIAEGGDYDDTSGINATLVAETSLQDHLLSQVGETFADPELRFVATHIVDLVDEAGYIREPLTDIALRLGIPETVVEAVLGVMQTFDPSGVCARNLTECLKIQARELNRLDPAMSCFLDHLDLLGRGELAQLRRLCRIDDEDLQDMIQEIRQYNPKPGLAFGGERVQTVVPDILVRRAPEGGWGVELNSATLPRVLINRRYYVELASRTGNRSDKAFLSECLQSANWLTKALDQRARTILKVSTELVRQQQDFFEHGVRNLRPLNLRMIAEAIGMHESTVSRVTTAKYLSSPRGLFELKYFFTSAIQAGDGGEAHSAEAVKMRIRELIDAEDPKTVLSDDKLVEILQRESFDIARRTVAKYRESMRIPSSVERRRAKTIANGGTAPASWQTGAHR